jgi:V/A-type H+-transporting ATPase subunit I
VAIVKMNKFSLLIFDEDKIAFLEKLQVFQNVEIINLQSEQFLQSHEGFEQLQKESLPEELADYEDNLSKAGFSLEFLKEFIPKKKKKSAIKPLEKLTLQALEKQVMTSGWLEQYENIRTYKETLKKEAIDEDTIQTFLERIEDFQYAYEYYHNLIERTSVLANFLRTKETLLIAGWVPMNQNEAFETLIRQVADERYHLEFEEVKEHEKKSVPIKLQNGKITSKFETLTQMYSLPAYDEIDPTPLLVPFYLLFFGMMVADFGYGALMMILTLLAPKIVHLTPSMENFMSFFFWLSIPTMGFGLLYGSIFGDIIRMPALIEPTRDINTLLLMSVGFGLLHIFFGLGIKAFMLIRDGKPLAALFDVGSWLLTISGAVLFALGAMMEGFTQIARPSMFVMIGGMSLVVLTQGRASKSIGGKIGGGLYALFGITNYVGDIVSYTRLMALGLAGGSIAAALNLIMRFFPGRSFFIVGPIFFVAAHSFNIFLSLLGAYVHSCRLQYVEYFGKFYEGGGRAFNAFRPLNRYVEVKK